MSTYDLPISGHEAHVLLRAIAAYNDLPDTSPLDRSTGTWVVDRILRGFPGLTPNPDAVAKAAMRK
jgi:hypothetical protein